MTLTDEEIRIKVAEAVGFTNINSVCWRGHLSGYEKRIPNYPEDLNAMHEAEKVFTEGQMGAYAYVLLETTGFREKSGVWLFHATARQRAEAFLRTLNLWKD